MKKTHIILILSIIILSVIIAYWIFASNNNYINEANEHLNINGLKLLMKEDDVKELLDKKFVFTGGFGCNPYINENDGINITFSGFPDVIGEYKLTDIKTTNSNYDFYKISVGDNVEEAINILEKNGFKKLNNDKGVIREVNFKKRKLFISFLVNDDLKITQITLMLESTNKNEVQF